MVLTLRFKVLNRNCFNAFIFKLLKVQSNGNVFINKSEKLNTVVFYKCYATSRSSFISQFLETLKQEFQKNKELKENLIKFREEAQKLEQSDALKKAREKYHSIEMETHKGREVFKEKLETFKEKLQDTIEEAQKTEILKKAGRLTEEITKSAKDAAESLSGASNKFVQTKTMQSIVEGVRAVKNEIDETTASKASVYCPPQKLRLRKQTIENCIQVDTKTSHVELHKDSRFWESWQHFKDHNPYINKVLDWKTHYNESDHVFIRASRLLTDRIADLFGGIFQSTEMSIALTEICKLEPNFDKISFLNQCRFDIIPNVLEALVQGNLQVLHDWCHEPAYNILSAPIKEASQKGLIFSSKILDITNVDLLMGKVIEQGPILVINFQTQEIFCIRNKLGEIVDGSVNKVTRVNYVWVLCRDPTEIDPHAAWRVMEVGASSTEQLL